MGGVDDLYGPGSLDSLREAFTFRGSVPDLFETGPVGDGCGVDVEWAEGWRCSLQFYARRVHWANLHAPGVGLYDHLVAHAIPFFREVGLEKLTAAIHRPESLRALRAKLDFQPTGDGGYELWL